MAIDLIITKAELEQGEYAILRRLNGARFGLQERLRHYAGNGEKVFASLKQNFLVQAIAYQKTKANSEALATPFSSYLAAKVGTATLSYQGEINIDFFENKKIDMLKKYPEPANDSMELYLQCLREKGAETHLESITQAFFDWIQQDSCQRLGELNFFKELSTAKVSEISYDLRPDEDREKNSRRSFPELDISQYKVAQTSSLPLASPASPASLESPVSSISRIPSSTNNSSINNYLYGHDDVKEEFQKLAKIIQHKDYFSTLFPLKELFRNYLLIGPPGTGKTSLVNNFADRCGLYFLRIPCVELGSEFFSKSASNIHGVYRSAKKKMEKEKLPGIIIFFDEIDHLAKRRGYGHSSESDSLITTLNENLDGGSSVPGLITIGATNVEGMIDAAILSRFQRLYVGYPSDDDGIIGIHQAVIKKMEDYSQKKMFAKFANSDYQKILPFSRQDERYKSGREINKILYSAAITQALTTTEKVRAETTESMALVTTSQLVAAYQRHIFESSNPEKLKLGTATVSA